MKPIRQNVKKILSEDVDKIYEAGPKAVKLLAWRPLKNRLKEQFFFKFLEIKTQTNFIYLYIRVDKTYN